MHPAWPAAEPLLDLELADVRVPVGGRIVDPRLDALPAGFAFLLGAVGKQLAGAGVQGPSQ